MNCPYDTPTIYLAEHPDFPLECNILILGRIQRAISRFNLDMSDSLSALLRVEILYGDRLKIGSDCSILI